jgi:cytochrome c oxidase subunit III
MSEAVLEQQPLPTGSISSLANGYWGMIGLIVTEAALFVYLEFSYYYYAVQPHSGRWPPDGFPSMRLSLPNTILLLASSAAVWWGERGTKRGARAQQLSGLTLGLLMGVVFVAIQGVEWENKTFSLSSGPYGSLFFIITGFHMAHVVVGLLLLLAVIVWSFLDYFGPARSAPVSISAIYWHFVDAVWLTVFLMFYLTPRLGLIWHAGPI